jgi:hypothetical protein
MTSKVCLFYLLPIIGRYVNLLRIFIHKVFFITFINLSFLISKLKNDRLNKENYLSFKISEITKTLYLNTKKTKILKANNPLSTFYYRDN